MKKLALVVALAAVITVAGVFADHPGGWGAGLVYQYGRVWDSDTKWVGNNYSGSSYWGVSLKAPQLPVFWGINLNFDDSWGGAVDYFGLNLTGDYLLIDKTLIRDINLGWYAGIGGRFGYGNWSGTAYSATNLFLGVRGVIGLSLFPINALEIFVDVAPSLGADLYFGDWHGDNAHFPAGGWGGDFGLRYWF